MMSFENFEKEVRSILQGDEKWLHILPSIGPELRTRFIQVLEAGTDMPLAFDLVLVTKDMDEATFQAKWKQFRPNG